MMDEYIYKYVLGPVPEKPVVFDVDPNFSPLFVGEDPLSGLPAIWARAIPHTGNEKRTFEYIGTGEVINEEGATKRYIGTAKCGVYVWHVFEILERPEKVEGWC